MVIAFNTTTAAMAFADICTFGRLIPLPAQVRAGCGLAFCAEVTHKAEIIKLLESSGIECFAIETVELY